MKTITLDTETTSANAYEAKLLSSCTYAGGINYCEGLPTADFHGVETVVGHNLKYDLVVLRRNGFPPFPKHIKYADTMIMQYLLDISQPRKLETLVKKYFKVNKKDLLEVYNDELRERRAAEGKSEVERKTLPDKWYEEVSPSRLRVYGTEDVEYTQRLYEVLSNALQAQPALEKWYWEVEEPVMRILTEMELVGVKLDKKMLLHLKEVFEFKINKLENFLRFMAGTEELNLNSSKQLQEIMYDKFKLPRGRKTKTGWSTDHDSLRKIEYHAFPKKLLEYKELEKLLSTYIPMVDVLDENDRIHTNYNQTLTKTRRFSSDSPNLQNIPSRGEWGKVIKGCFIPKEGHSFLIADYSQMELRILAHASNDTVLVDAFNTDKDIHQITADSLKVDRHKAKIINFSIVYGTTEFGLSGQLGVERKEAKEFIRGFLNKYRGVEEYMQRQRKLVLLRKGWVSSVPANLPLYCGDTNTESESDMEGVYRRAINAPIQCGSQDILKKALVGVYKEMGLVPVLMVHDELVYELPSPDAEGLSKEIVMCMETAWELKVPLKVDYKVKERWEK